MRGGCQFLMNRASLSHERSSWVVIEIWRQPPLGVGEAHALALGPVLDLIVVDFADGEVLGFGVGEIQAAHGTGRPHSAALGQLDAGIILHLKQLPKQLFLGMIRAGRITGGRANLAKKITIFPPSKSPYLLYIPDKKALCIS